MIRVIKGLLAFAIVFGFMIFCFENIDELRKGINLKYDLHFFQIGPADFPVWVIFLIALATGIFITFLLEVMEYVKYSSQVRTQRRKIVKLEKKLRALNASTDDSSFETDDSEPTVSSDED